MRTLIGTSGEQELPKLRNPWSVTVTPDRIYVSDTDNHRVQVANKEGMHVRTIGVGPSRNGWQGESGNHQLARPEGIAVEPGPDGLVFIADFNNQRVHAFLKI